MSSARAQVCRRLGDAGSTCHALSCGASDLQRHSITVRSMLTVSMPSPGAPFAMPLKGGDPALSAAAAVALPQAVRSPDGVAAGRLPKHTENTLRLCCWGSLVGAGGGAPPPPSRMRHACRPPAGSSSSRSKLSATSFDSQTACSAEIETVGSSTGVISQHGRRGG